MIGTGGALLLRQCPPYCFAVAVVGADINCRSEVGSAFFFFSSSHAFLEPNLKFDNADTIKGGALWPEYVGRTWTGARPGRMVQRSDENIVPTER